MPAGHDTVACDPTAGMSPPASAFWWNTVMLPDGVSTITWVADADVSGLANRSGEPVVARVAEPHLLGADADGNLPRCSVHVPWIVVPSASLTRPGPSTVPLSRLQVPRNPATNDVFGRSYSSLGEPSCSICRPA